MEGRYESKMNNKGQGFQILLYVFIAVIVGVVLFTTVSQLVGDVTNTIDVANDSINSSDGNVTLNGKAIVSGTFVAYNSTDDVIIDSGNYTLWSNQISNGALVSIIEIDTADLWTCDGGAAACNWNVSYTYEPTTYDSSSGGRATALLIGIFFALAIAMIALSPVLNDKVMSMMNR